MTSTSIFEFLSLFQDPANARVLAVSFVVGIFSIFWILRLRIGNNQHSNINNGTNHESAKWYIPYVSKALPYGVFAVKVRFFKISFFTFHLCVCVFFLFDIVFSISLTVQEQKKINTQGHRPYMEDRYSVKATNDSTSVYGVFDGHGGARASEFCVDFLLKNLITDESFATSPPRALNRAFLKTDEQFLKVARSGFYEDGTTAIVAIVRDEEIFVGNAGDSRAVLILKDAQDGVVELSQDHKPNRRDEQERIEKAGGIVVHVGVWRVEGVLAVSRAIGDRAFKEYVISRPDVLRYERTEKDAFLVLASDGLWDVMSNKQVADEIRSCSSVENAAKRLTEKAFRLGSRDNICSLVVDLRSRTSGRATPKKRRKSMKKKRRPTPPKGGDGIGIVGDSDE